MCIRVDTANNLTAETCCRPIETQLVSDGIVANVSAASLQWATIIVTVLRRATRANRCTTRARRSLTTRCAHPLAANRRYNVTSFLFVYFFVAETCRQRWRTFVCQQKLFSSPMKASPHICMSLDLRFEWPKRARELLRCFPCQVAAHLHHFRSHSDRTAEAHTEECDSFIAG